MAPGPEGGESRRAEAAAGARGARREGFVVAVFFGVCVSVVGAHLCSAGRSLCGQSVPHVHVHVIPRGWPGDRFHGEEKNDELYPELQRAGAALSRELAAREEKEEAAAASAAAASAASAASAATAAVPAPDPFQRERKDRTLQEMEEEAAALRELFSRS